MWLKQLELHPKDYYVNIYKDGRPKKRHPVRQIGHWHLDTFRIYLTG